MQKTGCTYEELTGWERVIPEPLKVTNTWEKADFTKKTLADYIATAVENADIPVEFKKAYIDDLYSGVLLNLIKPKLAIVGRSDTGKSTLINALIGAERMPTAWTPTTSIAVYIKHISERPAFIQEECWVFKSHNGDECLWDEKKLYDEEYCRSWKLSAGGTEILRSFGTRQGANYDQDAGSAVIFLDSPVLNTCDIVDLPGFGTETESDDAITFAVAQKSDVVIYLSQANGFMRIEDITYLKRNIAELPVWEKKGTNALRPLSNLFIVASQAHTINNGNREQLKNILDVGCQNLLKTLSKEYWCARQQMSEYTYSPNGQDELRSRFFAYTTDIPDICEQFNTALTEILEALPAIIDERTKAFVRAYVAARKPNLSKELEKYEDIVRQRDKYIALYEEIKKNELLRVQDNDRRKNAIRAEIASLRDSSLAEFTEYIQMLITPDALAQMMRDQGIKNKKEDVELFGSSLQSAIQERCEQIITAKSEILSKKTEDYIMEFSNSVAKPFEENGLKSSFDAGWIFASALSTLSMIGGFGTFLASTISGVLVLTGAGISLGTSIFASIFSSSIFGPIGIAVGLVIAGGLGLVKLFGGGWQKSVAKKICASFDEKQLREKFLDGIKKYWSQTGDAFEEASTKLDEEWSKYVDDLKATIDNYDIHDVQNRINALNYISDFFDNIPL